MSLRLTTTKSADDDIRDIATTIAAESPISAQRFGAELWNALRLIAEQPDIGHEIEGFAVPLRRVRVSPRFRRYLVFYRHLDSENLEIVRVLHGARDITSLLAGSA